MAAARDSYKTGRLTAKAGSGAKAGEYKSGVNPIGLDNRRDGLIYVPKKYDHNNPAALAVMLHGAGASADQGLSLIRRYADEFNIIVVAPGSQAQSWDIITSHKFGTDVIYLDQALSHVFENYAIDTDYLAIGGFSDGASYALSLGLTNGDLFTHIIAFSPGFAYTLEKRGKPSVYMSHGVDDPVLPIDPCGRRIAPILREQGLMLVFQEFKGGHEIPENISKSAVEWFRRTSQCNR